MAISHICFRCGTDLARVRARREPIYRLPLVTCPACREHSVRRMHPLMRGRRSACRIGWSVLIMLVQACIGAALLGFSIALMISIFQSLNDPADDVAGLAVFIMVTPMLTVLLAIATGTWLSAGLSHLTRRSAWTLWLIVLVVVQSSAAFVYGIAGGLGSVGGVPGFLEWPTIAWGLYAVDLMLPTILAFSVVLLALAVPGLWPGLLLRRLHGYIHRSSRRFYRRWRRQHLSWST